MGNKCGYLSRYRADSYNEILEEPGFSYLMDELMIAGPKKGKFVQVISSVFENGSPALSYLFYTRASAEYTGMKTGAPKRIPVFGVKEKPHQVERTLNFYSWYICHPREITGFHFFDQVFGTEYITEKEAMELADPIPRLSLPVRQIKLGIASEVQLTVCHMAEKLWELMEKNPSNRIVFLMDRADTESMSLLQQMYMLLPPQLRLEIGFATNIREEDLVQLFGKERLPIHVMTMERSVFRGGLHIEDIPLHVIDLTDQERYTYHAERMAVLEKLCTIVSTRADLCFGYAEEQVLKETREVISFELYQRIIDKFWSEELFWWKRKGISTLEQLREAFIEQKKLMDYEPLYIEALYTFYAKLMAENHYADAITHLLLEPEYPGREELLSFLKKDLQYGSEIEATENLISWLTLEKEQELDQVKKDAADHEQKELDELIRQMEAARKASEEVIYTQMQKEKEAALGEQEEYYEDKQLHLLTEKNAELQTQKEFYENELKGLQAEKEKYSTEASQCKYALEEANRTKETLQNAVNTAQKNYSALKKQYDESNKQAESLQEENQQLCSQVQQLEKVTKQMGVNELQDQLRMCSEEHEELQKQYNALEDEQADCNKKMKRFAVLSCILGIVAVAGIAGAGAFALQNQTMDRSIKDLQTRKQQVEDLLETEKKSRKQLESEYEGELQLLEDVRRELEELKEERETERETQKKTEEEIQKQDGDRQKSLDSSSDDNIEIDPEGRMMDIEEMADGRKVAVVERRPIFWN